MPPALGAVMTGLSAAISMGKGLFDANKNEGNANKANAQRNMIFNQNASEAGPGAISNDALGAPRTPGAGIPGIGGTSAPGSGLPGAGGPPQLSPMSKPLFSKGTM